jgi:hypothetical protein
MNFFVPILFGAFVGGLMGRFGGCPDGGCPLMATWWRGALYGGTIGLGYALLSHSR